MIEKKKGVSSLDFGKWGRYGLRGLSRGRGERERKTFGGGEELELRNPGEKRKEKNQRRKRRGKRRGS